ncbi:MAG: hypothetical protein AAB325_05055, partial [Pseudomonadota bacterium]
EPSQRALGAKVVVTFTERARVPAAARAVPTMPVGALQELTVEVPPDARKCAGLRPGLFEHSAN